MNKRKPIIKNKIVNMKKTVVIGASVKPERYAYKCIDLLRKHNIETIAIGNRVGRVSDVEITTQLPDVENVDTVAVYLSAKNLVPYYDYIVKLKPNRVLFPPGTENPEFYKIAKANNIQTEEACPLVMLNTGVY